MKTCKHYRFRIPQEDADELRAADPEPCPVCDTAAGKAGFTVVWSPPEAPLLRESLAARLEKWIDG